MFKKLTLFKALEVHYLIHFFNFFSFHICLALKILKFLGIWSQRKYIFKVDSFPNFLWANQYNILYIVLLIYTIFFVSQYPYKVVNNACMHAHSFQLCLTFCDPIDCSPPGSSVHGILQARTLEWVARTSSRIFPTQGSNPRPLCLLHWHTGYHQQYLESPHNTDY